MQHPNVVPGPCRGGEVADLLTEIRRFPVGRFGPRGVLGPFAHPAEIQQRPGAEQGVVAGCSQRSVEALVGFEAE